MRPVHVEDLEPRASVRPLVRNGAIAVGVVLVLAVPALLFIASSGWFEDNTWRARVISVDGSRVCTTRDAGERDPGWADPFCLDDGLVTEDGDVIRAGVGECVELASVHPAFYANKVVACN